MTGSRTKPCPGTRSPRQKLGSGQYQPSTVPITLPFTCAEEFGAKKISAPLDEASVLPWRMFEAMMLVLKFTELPPCERSNQMPPPCCLATLAATVELSMER